MTIDSSTRFSEVSDADLILGVRNGNRESEAQLFKRHKQLALAVAYRHTDTPSEAEDVVSEAFLRVFDALRRGLGPDEFFRAYLLTVVSREAFSRNDAASKHVVTDDVKEFEVGEPHADEALKRAEASFVISAFKSLPERWRAVLWHIEIEDLRPREIAPLLGLTPNAVSALAVRAREGLREAYLATHLNKHIDLAPTCSDARKLLPSLIRGNASNRDQRMVKAHLAVCEDCSAVFGELGQVGLKLRAYVLPLVVGGATALGISAVGGVATGTAAVAGGTTVFGMATGATAAASTSAAAGVGSSFAAGSVAAVGVSVGAGLTTVAVAASAAGLIPPIVAEDKQEKVAVQEAPAVPAPSATAVTTSPKIEAHQMFGDRATFDKYIVADAPKTELPVAQKSPAPSAEPPAPKPSATSAPETPAKPAPSPKPVMVPTVEPSPISPPPPELTPEATKAPVPTPEPKPTPTSSPEPTPEASRTPESKQTPTPTATPTSEPTPTPAPTPSPTPTPTPAPIPSDEPEDELNAETVQISMQRVEGQSVPAYDFMITPAAPAQKYDLKLRFKHADVIWPDPTSSCRVKEYSLSGMSISCVGEAVLRVNLIHVHDGQSIRFTMPSNPDFYKEFELGD